MEKFLTPQEIADNYTAHLAAKDADIKLLREQAVQHKKLLGEKDKVIDEARALASGGIEGLEQSLASRHPENRLAAKDEADMKQAALHFGKNSNGMLAQRLIASNPNEYHRLKVIATNLNLI